MKEVWQETSLSSNYEISNLGNLRSKKTKNIIQPLRNYHSERCFQIKVTADRFPDIPIMQQIEINGGTFYLRVAARCLVAFAFVPKPKSFNEREHVPVPIHPNRPWHYADNLKIVSIAKLPNQWKNKFLRKRSSPGRTPTDYSPIYDQIIDAICDSARHKLTAMAISRIIDRGYPYTRARLAELYKMQKLVIQAEWPDSDSDPFIIYQNNGRPPYVYSVPEKIPLHTLKNYDYDTADNNDSTTRKYNPADTAYEDEHSEEVYGTEEDQENIRLASQEYQKRLKKRRHLESLIEVIK